MDTHTNMEAVSLMEDHLSLGDQVSVTEDLLALEPMVRFSISRYNLLLRLNLFLNRHFF